ncbi:MAG: choice-of-anchor L domain-containing protein, partial [Saprospiraceae bacterium]|nr:choice-of-anchor L domain-containing protein [Saprospiraceae bacterium]
MKKVTTLLLLANLFVCLLSAQSMLIDVPEGPARFPISLSESQSVIQLCDLEVGKTYQVVLSSRRWDNCDFWLRHEPWMQEYESQAIVFEASRTCQQVLVLHSCEDELDLTVSAGPFGKLQTSPLDARMMGIVAVNNNNVFSLIKDVFIGGDCFEVQGVTPIGNGAQTGTFSSGGSSINIEDGVIISTGDVTNTNGANNSSSTTSGFTGPQNEIDLDDLGGGSSLYDVAGIEFDFTPTVEQVSFEYVFASEEYCEFAGSQFNDVFGFFISGPGINGPFSNGAENIAIIPGNGQYVGINTVNHTTNTAFYFNNNPPGQNAGCSPTPPQAPNDIEFDGFTSVFTAIANVIPCETYHIKLVIADRGDSSYDSAVFLKANSFNAGATAAVSVDVDQGPTSITAYEGCSDGYFIFERVGGDLDEPFPVTFNVSFASTAEAGSDYAPFPTTVIIPPGQTTFTLPIDVFADFEFEGTEQIIIELEDACNCTSNVAILEIIEPPLLDVFIPDIFACQGEEITITPDVSGGIPGYTYQWSNGSTSPSITVTPEDPVSGYTLTVFDECNQQMTTFVTIYSNSPSATLSGEDVICQGDFEAYLQVEFEGFGPFNITYEVDGFIETINGVFGSPFQLPASIPGTYTLLSVEAEGCPGDVSGTGEITIAEVLLDADTTDISCFGLNDGAIDLSPTGGTAPYTYDWNQGLGNVEDVDSLAAGTYTVEVADANGCSSTASFEIIDAAPIDLEFDSIQNIDCTNPNDGAVSANLSGGAGGFTYAWSEGSSSETLDNLSGGTYYLTATDASGCEVIDSVTIVDNIAIPTASAMSTDTLDCATSVVEIDASNSATGGMLNYTWDTNDGSIVSGAQGLNPEVNAPGTYTLIVFDPSNNCADTTSVEIIQDIETPIADAGLADTLNCDATSILLNGEASSNGTEFSYSWTSTDGNIVDGASELAPEIDAPGTYQLIVTNTLNSCTDTAQVLIDQDILEPTVNIGTPEIV